MGRMLASFWSVLTWPFRAIALAIEGLGRVAAGLVGFVLMAAGFAGAAGGYYLIGLALGLGGLILTLRALG